MALALRIDPWASEYDSALQLDEEPDQQESLPGVRTDVETDDWRLIEPPHQPMPSPVVFIDGVQRIELRVLTDHEGRLAYGAFASVGVGAVFASEGEPYIESQPASRTLALSCGLTDDTWSVPCGSAVLDFEVTSWPEGDPTAIRKAVSQYRRDREARLGVALVDRGHPLVIVDGRLRFTPSGGFAVGMTKTLHREYLPSPQSSLVRELRPGARTPVFEIPYHDPLYSWYTRLAEPSRIDHCLAGVVRLETMASVGIERAAWLADLTTVHLPRFASSPIWDSRAPQNLYPFAALENRLRHELGDHLWVRRAIEAHITGGGP